MTSEMNFDTIPSLTLEPDLESTVPAETVPQEPQAPEVILTAEEQAVVDAFAEKIDIENTAQILQYGAGAQKKMADFSDSALAAVRTQDLGEVGDLLVEVDRKSVV